MILNEVPLAVMVGETIQAITGLEKGSDEVVIATDKGSYILYHEPWCCEWVTLEDFEGELDCLVGGLIVSAEVVTDYQWEVPKLCNKSESYTWTFYKIETS